MARIDNEALAWVVRQSNRELDPQEQAAFQAWFDAHPSHPGAYLRACAIERTLGKLTLDDSQKPSREALHEGLDARLFRAAGGRRRFLASGVAAGLAAGMAAVCAVVVPRLQARTVLDTARGEFRKVPLPDSSVVSLNGASRVEVRLTAQERRIALTEGEAWFEVAKDKARPFVVDAGGVVVRAVGTAFAVRRRKGGAEVAVTEGVVEVWAERGTARKRRLAAGEHAWVPERAAAIAVAREPGEVERRLAWRDGKLVFQDQPLADAVAEFNRYNARTLVIVEPRLRGEKFVGQYRIDQPERFADDVHTLLGVPVSAGPDVIEIGKRPR